MTVYDADAVSPGYWFVAPYHNLSQESDFQWTGPHIYDQDGELVWSGAPQFNYENTFDFRVALRGKLTTIHQGAHTSVIWNNDYSIDRTIDMLKQEIPEHVRDFVNSLHKGRKSNVHEFNILDDGRALIITNLWGQNSSKEESASVGYEGECRAMWHGFKEIDLQTNDAVFEWSAYGHISLNESTFFRDDIQSYCNGEDLLFGWDFLHFNSIDKFPDGDYLVSARHTSAIYRISHTDGSIIWRLGGTNSDFEHDPDTVFSRQHDARYRGQNETHLFISAFDNAMGDEMQNPTNDMSRGILLALDTNANPKTVDLVAQYTAPDGYLHPSRGNLQFLESGNVVASFADASMVAEYTSDGQLIFEGCLKIETADSYRAYKFPWHGHPAQPPDIHSAAITTTEGVRATYTIDHVSWNGATEVASWRLYRCTADGGSEELIDSAPRQGFETMLWHDEFASYVFVEAVDRDGAVLARSDIVRTRVPSDVDPVAVISEETLWLQDHSASSTTLPATGTVSYLENPFATFFLGVASTVVLVWLLMSILTSRLQRRRPRWGHVRLPSFRGTNMHAATYFNGRTSPNGSDMVIEKERLFSKREDTSSGVQ